MNLFRNKKNITLFILAQFTILVFFNSYASASPDYYPAKGWQISTPEERGMRSQILADMMEVIEKNSYNIDSVLIIRNGYMLNGKVNLIYIQHYRILNPLGQNRNTIINTRINVAIAKVLVQEVVEFGCIFPYHFPHDGVGGQGCAFVFAEQISEGQGDGSHGDDSHRRQTAFPAELGRVDRIHHGMMDHKALIPGVVPYPFADGNIPLTGAAGTAV